MSASAAGKTEKGSPFSTQGRYRERQPPSAALRPYVACVWTRHARPSGTTRVLPDGCIDLLFDLVEARSKVVGAMTRPLVVVENGASRWLGVRFRPGGAFPFLRFNLGETTDSSRDLGLVWPEAFSWAEELAYATSADDMLSIVDRVLVRKLAELGSPTPDPRVSYATRILARTGGAVDASKLSDRIGLSRQHLSRLFKLQVGLSVKRFARTARLQASTRLLHSGPGGATLAARAGFFDQSHFISDFKALAGVTPSQFLREAKERGEGSSDEKLSLA